eukprot:Gb_17820 [translate_table: standard]
MAGIGGRHQPPLPPPRVNPWLEARYRALQLPANLHDMPEKNLKLLPKFNGDNEVTVKDHMSALQDCIDNLAIDHKDVYLRMFVQSLEGDARKWFRNLPPDSIDSWVAFHNFFMEKWGEKKDHRYYLSEFGSMKKKDSESVNDFNKRFNKMYNDDIRPSQAVAKVAYVAAYDLDFAMILRERRSGNLDIMQNDAIDIEGNMVASGKIKLKTEAVDKKKQKEGVSQYFSTSQDAKMEEMTKLIRALSNKVTRLELGNNATRQGAQNVGLRNQNFQVRNPVRNQGPFRRPFPQLLTRERRPKDPPIQPPLRNDNNVILNDNQNDEYLLPEDDNQFLFESQDSQGDMNWMEVEGDFIHLTQDEYEESMACHDQINNFDERLLDDYFSSQYRLFVDALQAELHHKYDLRPRVNQNLKNIDPKLKAKDDSPQVLIGPHFEEKNSATPPFYISIMVHDHLLHNCMLDSGASHNLMPKVIMEKLGLEITRPYKDLYSFDSRKVKCIGMIKDLVITLAQIPTKGIMMDVVVADIPVNYGMLLSRSWGEKLGGRSHRIHRFSKPTGFLKRENFSYVLQINFFTDLKSDL